MSITNDAYQAQIAAAADFIKQKIVEDVQIAIVLGSGLSNFADTAFDGERGELSYDAIPGLPRTTVVGHRGKLYFGKIGGKFCVCFAGRFHSYEGHPPHILTLLPRLAAALGARIYILTNAAGGTLYGMQTGCLMSITSHGTTTRFSALYGCENFGCSRELNFTTVEEFKQAIASYDYPRLISSQDVYSKELIAKAHEIATDPYFVAATQFYLNGEARRVYLHEGVYVFNSGPTFESHAETQYCLKNAPGVVGMSSAPEALMARALGLQVYGMSLITNLASGLSDEIIAHEDVTRVANSVAKAVQELVARLVAGVDLGKCGASAKSPALGALSGSTSLIQTNEQYATSAEVDAFCKELAGATGVTLYTLNTEAQLETKVIDQTAFIGIPRQIGQRTASLILYACQKLGIGRINFVDRSLPSGTKFKCSDVVNMTGWQYFPYKKTAGARRSNAPKLVLVDGIEDPKTNVYIYSFMKSEGVAAASACTSAVPVVLADMLGFDLFVVSPDLCSEKLSDAVPQPLEPWTLVPRFNVFSCSAPKYEDARLVFDRLPAFTNVTILDFKADTYDYNVAAFVKKVGAQKIAQDLGFDAFLKDANLIVAIPPLYANNTFKEIALVARVISFNKDAEIVVYCDCAEKLFEVTDVCNQAAINPLRGENDERFGPRFNDLSNIVSGRKFKKISGKIAVLTLAPFMRCQEASSSVGELVAEGGLQIMVVLSHQGGGKRWAVCGPLEQLLALL